jgi:hypothetical protein
MTREANINPTILRWARESAGLDLSEAAARLGLSSSENTSGEEKLVLFDVITHRMLTPSSEDKS